MKKNPNRYTSALNVDKIVLTDEHLVPLPKVDPNPDGCGGVPCETDPYGTDAHAPGAKLDAGKPRCALVLGDFARALRAVSEVGTYGAIKYTEHGWLEVPQGIERYDDAAIRHWLDEKIEGFIDPETELIRTSQMAWNCLARLELLLREWANEK